MGLSVSNATVYETYANVSYEIDGWYSGDAVAYKWSFNDSASSGSVRVNLNQNEVQFNCSCDITEIDYEYDDKGNPIGEKDRRTHTENHSITIYRHPGQFSMNAISGQTNPNDSNSIINNVLTANKINNNWIPHFQQAYRWWHQSDVVYSGTNIVYHPTQNPSGLKVNSGDPIYAGWFNNCMTAMNTFNKGYTTVSGGTNGTIITAELINRLNFSGKSG